MVDKLKIDAVRELRGRGVSNQDSVCVYNLDESSAQRLLRCAVFVDELVGWARV